MEKNTNIYQFLTVITMSGAEDNVVRKGQGEGPYQSPLFTLFRLLWAVKVCTEPENKKKT